MSTELSTLNKVDLSVFKKDTTLSEQDKKKIKEYAKLIKTQNDLHKEIQKVSRLINFLDAKWCKDYIWTNQKGESIPVFDIEDDYLKNIYNFLTKNKGPFNPRGKVPKGIMNEYVSRFGIPDDLPDESASLTPWEDDEDMFF